MNRKYMASFYFCVAALSAVAANAQDRIYTEAEIRNFTVAGLTLNMPASVASSVLLKEGYTGHFGKFTSDETSVSGWRKGSEDVFPFRYQTLAGEVRLAEVQFKQRFDSPQSVDILMQKVLQRYGRPSSTTVLSDRRDLKYHVLYRCEFASCGDNAAYLREQSKPALVISITPTEVDVDLTDVVTLDAAEASIRAAAEAAKNKQRIKNSQGADLHM